MIINNEKRNLNKASLTMPYIRINYRAVDQRYISLKSICNLLNGVVDQFDIIKKYEHHQKYINVMPANQVFYVDIDDMIYIIKHEDAFTDSDNYYDTLFMLDWWKTILTEDIYNINININRRISAVYYYIKEKGQVHKTELWRQYQTINKYERFIIMKELENVIETKIDETSTAKKKPIIYKYIAS